MPRRDKWLNLARQRRERGPYHAFVPSPHPFSLSRNHIGRGRLKSLALPAVALSHKPIEVIREHLNIWMGALELVPGSLTRVVVIAESPFALCPMCLIANR